MPRKEEPPRLVKLNNRENWYIRYRGQTKSTGTADRTEAEQCLIEVINKLEAPASHATVSELLEKRLADIRAKGRARAENTPYYHKHLHEHFGKLLPEQITSSRVYAYWKKREHRPGGLRAELIELRTTLSHALKKGWIESVPEIDIPRKAPPREKWLKQEEAYRLLEAAGPQHLKVFILIAMSTAARKSAILQLTWDRVNLDRPHIDFQDPDKEITGKRRTVVPISSATAKMLSDVKRFAQTPYVVEYNGKPLADIKKSFRQACVNAGLEPVSPHVLKHSVISWLAMAGHSIDQISDMTATTRETVTRVYRKWSPEYLSSLAETLAPRADIVSMFTKPEN